MSKHVCILGCGRSGTSIFGELFQSIEGYTYYSEPTWEEFTQIDFSSPVAIKVPRSAKGTTPQNGLPFTLDEFYKIFPPSGVLVWQVRHPLDAICSLRVGISKSWGHHPKPPNYKEWQQRPLIEQCAHHWNYINTTGYLNVKDLVVINRFEDMIHNPEVAATNFLSVLGIDIKSNLPGLKQWSSRVQNQENGNFIEAMCSRPYSTNDHSVKVGRWKENLSKLDLEKVLPIIRKGAALFDYQLP